MFKATHLWVIPFDDVFECSIELEQIGPHLYRDDCGTEYSFPPSGKMRKGKLEKIA